MDVSQIISTASIKTRFVNTGTDYKTGELETMQVEALLTEVCRMLHVPPLEGVLRIKLGTVSMCCSAEATLATLSVFLRWLSYFLYSGFQ